VFAVGRLDSRRPETRDITTSERFRHSKNHLLLARENLLGDLLAKRFIVQPLLDGRQTDHHAGHVSILEA
jgi:hypothetical protein